MFNLIETLKKVKDFRKNQKKTSSLAISIIGDDFRNNIRLFKL